MKIITASRLFRPGSSQPYRSESQTVQIRLSGKWLEKLGFKPGTPIFVEIKEGTVILSPTPPEGEPAPATLEEIKRQYAALNIPTTRTK